MRPAPCWLPANQMSSCTGGGCRLIDVISCQLSKQPSWSVQSAVRSLHWNWRSDAPMLHKVCMVRPAPMHTYIAMHKYILGHSVLAWASKSQALTAISPASHA